MDSDFEVHKHETFTSISTNERENIIVEDDVKPIILPFTNEAAADELQKSDSSSIEVKPSFLPNNATSIFFTDNECKNETTENIDIKPIIIPYESSLKSTVDSKVTLNYLPVENTSVFQQEEFTIFGIKGTYMPLLNQYQCCTCETIFSTKPLLEKHCKTHLSSSELHCSQKFLRASKYKLHVRSQSGQEFFKCEECSSLFRKKITLRRHIESHSAVKPFPSELCNAKFPPMSYKRIHMDIQSSDRLFICDSCGGKFDRKSIFDNHALSHSVDGDNENSKRENSKNFVCEVCDKAFGYRCNLLRHMMVHSGEKPFKCNLCTADFKQKCDLTRHIRIHSNEKPYRCSLCVAAFTQKSSLSAHFLIHSSDKPYKCDICDSTFSQDSYLKKHLIKHNAVKAYVCEYCGKSISRKSSFNRHLKRHKAVEND